MGNIPEYCHIFSILVYTNDKKKLIRTNVCSLKH